MKVRADLVCKRRGVLQPQLALPCKLEQPVAHSIADDHEAQCKDHGRTFKDCQRIRQGCLQMGCTSQQGSLVAAMSESQGLSVPLRCTYTS